MIHELSLQRVSAQRDADGFCAPNYSSYCFSHLPQTIRWLLTHDHDSGLPLDVLGPWGRKCDTVIFLFIDALGWRLLAPYLEGKAQSAFVQRVAEQGVVAKLTAQFPSTTAAHVTTIHGGMPVGEHGIYEWYYYEPQIQRIICPLRYCCFGDSERLPLSLFGLTPEAIFPPQTLYLDLEAAAVQSFVYNLSAYADSPFSRHVGRGATAKPYQNLEHALTLLAETLRTLPAGQKSYHLLYWDEIDRLSHIFGPESVEVQHAVQQLWSLLEGRLHRDILAPLRHSGDRGETLVLLTADHGQTPIDAGATLYLDQELPEIIPWLRVDPLGRPLMPAGSMRDLFVQVREGYLAEVERRLLDRFQDHAVIRRTADLLSQGYFGPEGPQQQQLRERLGELVLLPYEGESIWWSGKERRRHNYRGHHGGMTPEEMEIPLLIWGYSGS